jgi:hypothetical protein
MPVTVSGPLGQVEVRGIDLNKTGLGILSRQPAPVGNLVFVRLPDCGRIGFAFVRHCTRKAAALYHIGLQFREPIRRDSSTDFCPDSDGWQHIVSNYTGAGWTVEDDQESGARI